jgi:hypothetical protein
MMATQGGSMPSGQPPAEHWPDGKGYWQQPARVVEMVNIIRSEWFHAMAPPESKKKKAPASKPPTRRRRK